MAKGLRACPICPSCGSKKFKIMENAEGRLVVECLSCARRISI